MNIPLLFFSLIDAIVHMREIARLKQEIQQFQAEKFNVHLKKSSAYSSHPGRRRASHDDPEYEDDLDEDEDEDEDEEDWNSILDSLSPSDGFASRHNE